MKLRAIAPVALVALIAAACADSSSTTSNDGGIEHPTGADQLVLRVATGGGFTAPEYQLRLIPEFSLYGDGSIITPGPQIEIYPPPALPSVQTQPVSEDGVQAILQAAIDAGVDTDHDMTDMGSTMVADAATTTFTISVNGATNSFGVYALGMFDGKCPDAHVREGMRCPRAPVVVRAAARRPPELAARRLARGDVDLRAHRLPRVRRRRPPRRPAPTAEGRVAAGSAARLLRGGHRRGLPLRGR